MKILAAIAPLLAGLLFGAGLILSGMTDPANIIGFLDVTGHWNPRLAFVMGAAVLVAAPAFAWARRGANTFGGEPIKLPNRWPPDFSLVAGAVIFGIGWGLSGLCPGPALLVAAGGNRTVLVFVAAMALGMWLSARVRKASRN